MIFLHRFCKIKVKVSESVLLLYSVHCTYTGLQSGFYDEWVEQGVIEPVTSLWTSPLVPVKKKDRRTRWVTDLRLLNAATVKDAYSLTNI